MRGLFGPAGASGVHPMSQTASRIAALLREMPARDSDRQTLAAWFESKAEVFDAIADEDPSMAAEAAEFAHKARATARRLRAGGDL